MSNYALIVVNPQVMHLTVVREEAQGDMGLFRYRLTLRDGGLLEMFERFRVVEGRLRVAKYSFHSVIEGPVIRSSFGIMLVDETLFIYAEARVEADK